MLWIYDDYHMMVVNFCNLLQLIIAYSMITFSNPSYNLMLLFYSFIIKIVLFFLAYNLLFTVCRHVMRYNKIMTSTVDSLLFSMFFLVFDCNRSCVIFLGVEHGQYATCNICLLFVLITILVFSIVIGIICSVLHIHLRSPCI